VAGAGSLVFDHAFSVLREAPSMPATMSVDEAQSRLKELVDSLAPGEEIVLTRSQQPVARLIGERPARPPRPAPGLGRGSILYIAPDFDEPMDEFKKYTE
jgi:antitoxin (DNA-binding transcriptional repressor) of toxin-antitoxin stability system